MESDRKDIISIEPNSLRVNPVINNYESSGVESIDQYELYELI